MSTPEPRHALLYGTTSGLAGRERRLIPKQPAPLITSPRPLAASLVNSQALDDLQTLIERSFSQRLPWTRQQRWSLNRHILQWQTGSTKTQPCRQIIWKQEQTSYRIRLDIHAAASHQHALAIVLADPTVIKGFFHAAFAAALRSQHLALIIPETVILSPDTTLTLARQMTGRQYRRPYILKITTPTTENIELALYHQQLRWLTTWLGFLPT